MGDYPPEALINAVYTKMHQDGTAKFVYEANLPGAIRHVILAVDACSHVRETEKGEIPTLHSEEHDRLRRAYPGATPAQLAAMMSVMMAFERICAAAKAFHSRSISGDHHEAALDRISVREVLLATITGPSPEATPDVGASHG